MVISKKNNKIANCYSIFLERDLVYLIKIIITNIFIFNEEMLKIIIPL